EAAAHAVPRDADRSSLYVSLSREKVEEGGHIGHDVGRRRSREELLHQDLALLRIREDGPRVHGLIGTYAVEEVRQQYEIAVSRQPLSDLQHDRTDGETVHEDEHRGPRACAPGPINIAGT